MKRKMMMMGLAMITGLPSTVCATSGSGASLQALASGSTSYMLHYGAEGAAKPLMDHVSAASVSGHGANNAWRLEFVPPAAVSTGDDPLSAKDRRVGFSLKLGF